jgi:hypothetical protein
MVAHTGSYSYLRGGGRSYTWFPAQAKLAMTAKTLSQNKTTNKKPKSKWGWLKW